MINEQLIEQKDSVININKNINWKNYKLIKQNKVLEEVVSKGSVLKIEDIEVEAIKYKSTGKEASTKYAKKTQKLSICFNISANQIAKAELKQAYIQILKPDGSILHGMEDIFIVVEDEQILCTTETEFNYKNIQMSHCLEWERLDVLESGFYTLIIFLEGKNLNNQYLSLKVIEKIVSYNINGIRTSLRKGIDKWMLCYNPDIVCLQEIKANEQQFNVPLFNEIGYNCYLNPATKPGYSGVAILSKEKPLHVEYGCGIHEIDQEGRLIRLDFSNFSIMSVYFPSGSSGEIRQNFKIRF